MAYKLISVDVESDGQIPPDFSMVCLCAVLVEPSLSKTFYGQTRPISDKWNPDALAISGFSREEHLKFDDPVKVMTDFAIWIKEVVKGTPVFISDNNGYDFAWINYYFHKYYGSNPFGWSSRRIGDLFCGAEKSLCYKWKQHRIEPHLHDPVGDAKGNAEAILYLSENYGIKIN